MMPFAHPKQKELTLYSWKQEDQLEGVGGDKELWDRTPHSCPHQAKSHFQPQTLPPTWYLSSPKLQRLLPGFLKVFLLAHVGLMSRSREDPLTQGKKEELRRMSPPGPSPPLPSPGVSRGQVCFTHYSPQMAVVSTGWLRSK